MTILRTLVAASVLALIRRGAALAHVKTLRLLT